MNLPPRLLTPGRISQELHEPPHRIQYVLSTRSHIRPAALAGNIRLYDQNAMAQIQHELNVIDARRAANQAVPHSQPS